MASGHARDKTTGLPVFETRLYLLVPNPAPPARPAVVAPAVSFTAVVNTAASYTGVFSGGLNFTDAGLKVSLGDGHTITITGSSTAYGAQGPVTPDGAFTAVGIFTYTLTITGPLDLDRNDNSLKPLQTLSYVLDDPAGTKSGTLTLTRN